MIYGFGLLVLGVKNSSNRNPAQAAVTTQKNTEKTVKSIYNERKTRPFYRPEYSR